MNLRTVIVPLLQYIIGVETLVRLDQNAPKAGLPFWTYKLSVHRGIGVDGYGQGVDNAGNIKVKGVREATLNIQRIGDGAVDKVTDFRDDLTRITVQERFQQAKISLYDIGDVQDVPYPLDGDHLEPRASLDLFIRFGTELLDQVGIIETVVAEGHYINGVNGDIPDPDLDDTITIVL